VPIYLLGGVQLLSLGIVGEYVARIYSETKARPRFIIERLERQTLAAVVPETLLEFGLESHQTRLVR
jgi:hypothetical protein